MIAPLLFLLLQAPQPTEAPARFDPAAAIAREASLAQTAAPVDGEARAALQRILAERAFSRARAESWQAALMRRAREWLARIWERAFGRSMGRRAIATALAWTVASAALVVLLIWLLRVRARAKREGPISMGPIEATPTPGRILAMRAQALIAEGNLREGARLAYQASLSRLAEEGALRLDEARTPRESLRLLPDRHRRRAPFARLTAIFERVWYGSRPSTAAGEEIVRLLRELECLSFDRAN